MLQTLDALKAIAGANDLRGSCSNDLAIDRHQSLTAQKEHSLQKNATPVQASPVRAPSILAPSILAPSIQAPSVQAPPAQASSAKHSRSPEHSEEPPLEQVPQLPAGLVQAHPVPTPPVEYIRSSVTNAWMTPLFEGSSMEHVAVIDCKWAAVSFVNCRLVNVRFSRLNLRNVHLYNLNLENVRITKVELEGDLEVRGGVTLKGALWSNLRIVNAVIGGLATASPPSSSNTLCLHVPPSPKTVLQRVLPKTTGFGSKLRADAITTEKALKVLWRKESASATFPESVLKVVAKELYPDVYVLDCPLGQSGTGNTRKTIYEKGWTTYITCHSRHSTSPASLNVGNGFLHTNRACRKAATERLQERRFHFPHSAEGCLAFLHEYKGAEHPVSNVTLSYHLSDSDQTFTTFSGVWRRLFNVLIHERKDLRKLQLDVCEDFWDVAPWDHGVKKVLTERWPTSGRAAFKEGSKRPNFLEHVRPCSEVDLSIVIIGREKAAMKEEFAQDLEQEMRQRREGRPNYQADPSESVGRCTARRLDHCLNCTYWTGRPKVKARTCDYGYFDSDDEW